MCVNVFTGLSYINTTLINSISLQQYLCTNFSLVIHVLVEPWLLPRIQGESDIRVVLMVMIFSNKQCKHWAVVILIVNHTGILSLT